VYVLHDEITRCNVLGPSTSKDEPARSGAEHSSVLHEAAAAEDETSEPIDECEDIKRKFLIEMPQDFYDFWDFAKTVNPRAPSGQFRFTVIEISYSCYVSVNVLVRGIARNLLWGQDRGSSIPQWGPGPESQWGFGGRNWRQMLISSYDGGHAPMSPLIPPWLCYWSLWFGVRKHIWPVWCQMIPEFLLCNSLSLISVLSCVNRRVQIG